MTRSTMEAKRPPSIGEYRAVQGLEKQIAEAMTAQAAHLYLEQNGRLPVRVRKSVLNRTFGPSEDPNRLEHKQERTRAASQLETAIEQLGQVWGPEFANGVTFETELAVMAGHTDSLPVGEILAEMRTQVWPFWRDQTSQDNHVTDPGGITRNPLFKVRYLPEESRSVVPAGEQAPDQLTPLTHSTEPLSPSPAAGAPLSPDVGSLAVSDGSMPVFGEVQVTEEATTIHHASRTTTLRGPAAPTTGPYRNIVDATAAEFTPAQSALPPAETQALAPSQDQEDDGRPLPKWLSTFDPTASNPLLIE